MEQDAAHDLCHLDRVWINVQKIAAGENQEAGSVLLAASYLHDLVNLPKNSRKRADAARLSAEKAGPLLQELGYSSGEVHAVQHAIAAHSYAAGLSPQTQEARILRDADRLEAIGAIGIARTFMVSGALKRALLDPDDPFAETRELSDQEWSLDHWQVKLLWLHRDMQTKTGLKIARQRTQFMLDFLATLADEIGIPLPEKISQFS